MAHRHADLMRQGFMKPARSAKPAKQISDAEFGRLCAANSLRRYREMWGADWAEA